MTLAVAHRGDPIAHRENTLAACTSAVALGADMVEIDLRRAGDGTIVVLHDSTLERLWGIDRAVADLGVADIRAVGEGDLRIPTLPDVLSEVDVPLMVDFTESDVVDGALADVRAAGALDRCLFVTGNVPALRLLRAGAADARIGLTWTGPGLPDSSLLAELGAEFWNPAYQLVTAERVAAVHGLGRLVSTWTVDGRADMERMVRSGVDAIVSNDIAALRAFLST